MSAEDQAKSTAPLTIRIVGWALVVGGVLYGVFGTIGVFSDVRSEALEAMVILGFGVACLLIGRSLLRNSRRAWVAAVVLLGLALAGGAIRSIIEGDRTMLAQLFLPGVGLWLLLMKETRDYFAR
jgi:hypothetical protein